MASAKRREICARQTLQTSLEHLPGALQCGAPQLCLLVYKPHENYSYTINHSEIGVICTNLANELGHHLVVFWSYTMFS